MDNSAPPYEIAQRKDVVREGHVGKFDSIYAALLELEHGEAVIVATSDEGHSIRFSINRRLQKAKSRKRVYIQRTNDGRCAIWLGAKNG